MPTTSYYTVTHRCGGKNNDGSKCQRAVRHSGERCYRHHSVFKRMSLEAAAEKEAAAPACPSSNTAVDHPPHYNVGKIEVIDFIEDQRLGFNLGNVVKYVARAEHKGKELEDLEKALWYIQRELARRKA